MKMKKIFTCLAMLLCAGFAYADGFTFGESGVVEVPLGGSDDLVVNFEITSETPIVGFTFTLGLPEGLSLVREVTGEDESGPIYGDPVYMKGSAINKLNIVCNENSIGGQPSSTSAKFSAKSGMLITLQLQADASLSVGQELTVNVSQATFQTTVGDATIDINLGDQTEGNPNYTFTVKIVENDGRKILDENSTTPPAATGGIPSKKENVRVKRTIKADTWSTICLPFDMTEDQIKTAFGDDVKLGDFNGVEYVLNPSDEDVVDEIVVKFNSASSIVKHHPYIIKVSKAITKFTVDAVRVTSEDAIVVKVDDEAFYGTYIAGTILADGRLFLSDGKFYYSSGKNVTKGFRGYFYFQYAFEGADRNASRIGLNFDGETTYINNLGQEINDGVYYDLQGRRVNNPGKGVYIQNGKKIFVK